MRWLLAATFLFTALPSPASAGRMGLDGLGGFGGFGFGGHHGGFGGGGFGHFDLEAQQTRFEDRFTDLMTEYDTGLSEITDFYLSEEYTEIVEDAERLTDRYDFFLSGVERSIDRTGDVIAILNDDVTYYQDLLADYQSRDDLSAERLERIETWLNRSIDRLTGKVDSLTELRTTLETNLPTYQSFATDLSAYLDEIIAAGGGTDLTATGDTAAALMVRSLALTAEELVGESTLASASASAVPEPGGLSLLLAACSMAMAPPLWRRLHRRP